MRVAVLVPLLVLGCETSARKEPAPALAPAPAPAPAPPPEGSNDRPPPATSRLGEYYWVAGQVNADKGRLGPAVDAFQRAISEFESEKKDIPAGLLCDYGAALRRRIGDARAAEQAARLLHRCFLTAPLGTPERTRALRELVELEPAGLDPALIGRDTPSDTYLIRPAAKAPTDKLKVTVARTQKAGDRGYEGWAKLLETNADARAALARCFEPYWQATQKTTVAAAMPVKLKARLDDDDEYAGGTLEMSVDPALTGPDKAFGECMATELKPLATEFAKRGSDGSWAGTVTVTLVAE